MDPWYSYDGYETHSLTKKEEKKKREQGHDALAVGRMEGIADISLDTVHVKWDHELDERELAVAVAVANSRAQGLQFLVAGTVNFFL